MWLRSISSSEANCVDSFRAPKYSIPTNFVSRILCRADSTALRSGCKSSHVELTNTCTVGEVMGSAESETGGPYVDCFRNPEMRAHAILYDRTLKPEPIGGDDYRAQ